jgi:hypothetical protein
MKVGIIGRIRRWRRRSRSWSRRMRSRMRINKMRLCRLLSYRSILRSKLLRIKTIVRRWWMRMRRRRRLIMMKTMMRMNRPSSPYHSRLIRRGNRMYKTIRTITTIRLSLGFKMNLRRICLWMILILMRLLRRMISNPLHLYPHQNSCWMWLIMWLTALMRGSVRKRHTIMRVNNIS